MTDRDPRDVALDALVQTRSGLTAQLALVNARIEELSAKGSANPRRHACPRCGVRFWRSDQLDDHITLIHNEAA